MSETTRNGSGIPAVVDVPELTARTRKAAADRLHKQVSSFKLLAGIAISIACAGFGAAVYFGKFAKADDLDRMERKLERLIEKVDHIDADNAWLKQAVFVTARSVGAPTGAPPAGVP